MPAKFDTFSAFSASGSLTTTYAALAVGGGDGSAPIPDAAWLSLAWLELSSIVTAGSILWYLAADAAGDVPLTPVQTTTIVTGKTTSTSGSVVDTLDIAYARVGNTAGRLYLIAKTNAGTATAVGWLSGEQR